MDPIETADVMEQEAAQGVAPVEGSSATTPIETPNTPEPEAPSGVEQAEVLTAGQAPPEGETAEVAEPQAEPEPEAVEDGAKDAKQEYKAKTGKRIEQLRAGKKAAEVERDAVRQQLEEIQKQFGLPPSPAPVAPAQPPLPPPAAAPPFDALSQDPLNGQIEALEQQSDIAAMQWQQTEDDQARRALARQWQDSKKQIEALKEQRTARRVLQQLPQFFGAMQRNNAYMQEVAEVSDSLPEELRFVQPGGRINTEAQFFKTMTAISGLPAQQLLADPQQMALSALSLFRRASRVAGQSQAQTQQQVINRQKQVARKIGIESGSGPSGATPPEAAQSGRSYEAQKRALEKRLDAPDLSRDEKVAISRELIGLGLRYGMKA